MTEISTSPESPEPVKRSVLVRQLAGVLEALRRMGATVDYDDDYPIDDWSDEVIVARLRYEERRLRALFER